MVKPENTKNLLLAALILTAAGVGIGLTGGTAAPAMIVAGKTLLVTAAASGDASTVIAELLKGVGINLLSDVAKKGLAWFGNRRKLSDGAADDRPLAVLAARAMRDVLLAAKKEYKGERAGADMLTALCELDEGRLLAAIDKGEVAGLGESGLLALVGAGNSAKGAPSVCVEAWAAFLQSARRSRNPAVATVDLTPAQREALDAAARRLAERFGSQFNALLREDAEHGAPALQQAEATLLRGIAERLNGIEATTKEMVAEQRQLSRWLVGEVDALTAEAIDRRIAADGTLPDQLAELRTVAWTSHGKIDRVFEATSRLLENTKEMRTLVAGGPKLRSLLVPPSQRPRMLYAARRVPMVGRKEELAELRAFLYGDQPVSWWLWHGPAGMGKSRLALELCREVDRSWVEGDGGLAAKGSAWVAGFLEAEASTQHDWSKWKPEKPTLIVVDYALGRAEMLRPWIAHVCEAAQSHNAANPGIPFPSVRFLLLDRIADEPILRQFTAEGDASLQIEHAQYRDAANKTVPLRALGEFTDSQLAEMVWGVYALNEKAGTLTLARASLPRPEAIVEAFRTEKQSLRPLFVTLAADAVCNGEEVGKLKEESLARDWLAQELKQWADYAQEPDAKTKLMGQFRAITALATMAGSLWYQEGYSVVHAKIAQGDLAEAFPAVGDFEKYERLMPWIFSLGEGSLPETIPPLEPDYLGELLVLEHLKDRAERTMLRHGMLRAACLQSPFGLGYLLMRISEDFPEHPITQLIFEDLLLEDGQSPFDPRGESTWTELRSIWAWQFRNDDDHSRLERMFERAANVRVPKAYLLATYASFLVNTKKNIEGGISVFERMVKLYPHDARTKLVFAVQLAEIDYDLPRAEKLFTEALSISPDNADYLWHYAQFMAIKRHRFSAALSSIRRAIAIEPTVVRHYLLHCNILCLWKLESSPKELERYRVLSRFQHAVREFAEMLSAEPLTIPDRETSFEMLLAFVYQLHAFGAEPAAISIVRDLANDGFAGVAKEFLPIALFVAVLSGVEVAGCDPLVLLARDLDHAVRAFSEHEFSRGILFDESVIASRYKWMPRLAEVLQAKADESILDDWPEWREAKAEAERMEREESNSETEADEGRGQSQGE